MKTAISLPDDVFRRAESLAKRLKMSRSELYSRAVRDYVARNAPDAVTDALNKVCAEVDSNPEPFVHRAARRTLEQSEW